VIIHNLDGVDATGTPDKAYPPLIIDTNTVLAFPIAGKGF
jgi:hypothetical protein